MNQEKRSPDESIGLDEEARVIEVLKTSVFGLWQVVNTLTRLRPRRAHRSAWQQRAGGRPVSFPDDSGALFAFDTTMSDRGLSACSWIELRKGCIAAKTC